MRSKFFIALIGSLFCLSASVQADITNGISSTFIWDMNDEVSTGSAPSGSNPYVLANVYVAEANTEGSQGNSTPNDSGIDAAGRAYAATHIMVGGGTGNMPPEGSFQAFSIQGIHGSSRVALDRIQFDIDSVGFNTPFFTGFLQAEVFASVDGFATSVSLGGPAILDKPGSSSVPGFTADFDLTGIAEFRDVSGGNIDFRMQLSDDLNDNGIFITLDNVTLDITAIPEPSAAGALGALAVALVRFRRRR